MSSTAPWRTFLAVECGLQRPRPALWRWPPDAHVALALLAAVPVWAVLAWAVGPSMFQPQGISGWLAFVLLWPLLEELVFRGLLQGQLLRTSQHAGQPRRIGPVTGANALTTLAFVALHLPAQPLAWALAVALPSLVFGHLRERFASVWPAVGLHMVYNGGFALTGWLGGWVAGYHSRVL
jgi:membrane protease YdiL (CAAX protease family)